MKDARARAHRQLQTLLSTALQRGRMEIRERTKAPRTSFRRLKAMERALRRARNS